MSWSYFVASCPACLKSVQDGEKSKDHQGILEQNIWLSVKKCVLQDNNQKHTLKHIQKWARRKHWVVLTWLSISPDVNPVEGLWERVEEGVGEECFTLPAEKSYSEF